MYTVLIVDDFLYDRENISDIIRSFSNSLGVEVAGLCKNGEEAMEFICRNKPDIAVCDVEMPGMNGFELARNIQQNSPNTKIIFCSVYDKFEYAREAIYLDSCGYILKPVNSEDLFNNLKSVILKIEEEKNDEVQYEQLKRRLQESKSFLVESLMKRLVSGVVENGQSVYENMEYLGVPLNKGFYIMALIEVDDFFEKALDMNIEQRNIYSLKIYTDIDRLVQRGYDSLCIGMDEAHILVLFHFERKNSVDEYMDEAVRCCRSVNRYLGDKGISVSISVSSYCSNLLDIKFLYEQCIYIMKYKYLLGKGKVLCSTDLPSSETIPAVDYNAIERNVRYLMHSGSEEEIRQYMSNLFSQLPEDTAANELKNICFYIAVCMQNVIMVNKDMFRGNTMLSPSSILQRLLRMETVLDAEDWLLEAMLLSNCILNNSENKNNKMVVDKVKRFIDINCHEELSLNLLSEKFFYSPNYLNHIFKKESGETVLEYITRARMEKAKEMLADQGNKVHDIAKKLGYSRDTYFISLFKRHTGLTPQEFRRHIQ